MTLKTTNTTDNPTNRAQIERKLTGRGRTRLRAHMYFKYLQSTNATEVPKALTFRLIECDWIVDFDAALIVWIASEPDRVWYGDFSLTICTFGFVPVAVQFRCITGNNVCTTLFTSA